MRIISLNGKPFENIPKPRKSKYEGAKKWMSAQLAKDRQRATKKYGVTITQKDLSA